MQLSSPRCTLRHTTLLYVFASLFLLSICIGAWPTDALAQQHVYIVETVGETTPLSGPTTVQTTVQLGPDMQTEQGIWLAGLASKPHGEPTELGISLAQVGTGWLGPRWGVFLHGSEQLIPRQLAPLRGSGLLEDNVYVQLHNNPLPWEHEFQVTLGYDPNSGIASVSVYNMTEEEYVVNRNVQLGVSKEPLYPVAGIGSLNADDEQVPEHRLADIASFQVEERIAPAPFSWWIMQRTGTRPFTSSQQLDRRQDTVVSVHLPWNNIPGTVRVRLQDETGNTVRIVDDATSEEYVPFSIDNLAAGLYQAVVEYEDGANIWPLAQRDILIGTMHMALQSVAVVEHTDEELVLEGVIDVVSDGALGDIEVGVFGDVIQHTFVFDEESRTGHIEKHMTERLALVDLQLLDASSSGQLPFRSVVPMPSEFSDAGWELKIEPYAYPDEYAFPSERTSLWLQRPTEAFPWLGFLQDEEATLTAWTDGVHVINIAGHLPDGPLKMHLVAIDVTQPHIAFDALIGTEFDSEGGRWARSKVGDMIMESGALLGINAAFFDIRNTMNPVGMVVQTGQLLKSGTRPVIALQQDNTPYIGDWQWHGNVRRADSSQTRTIVGLNETNMNDGIGMYRWPATHTAGQDVQLVLTHITEEDDTSSHNRILRGVVQAVHVDEGPLKLTPDTVVLGGSGGNGTYLQQTFDVDDEVVITYRLLQTQGSVAVEDWRDIWSAVSGGVVLLQDGDYGEPGVQNDTARHPRTAVAISEDRNTLYWLVAEGRSVSSIGMTYQDMADYFLHLGAGDALNLDGGGSSTLAGRDPDTGKLTIINVTSDGGQRYVPDGLGLFIKEPAQ